MRTGKVVTAIGIGLACAAVHAAEWMPTAAFIAGGGVTLHGTRDITAGVAWPWQWAHPWFGGQWGGATELFVSHWSAKEPAGGRAAFTQMGLVPIFRNRFDSGRSPLFVEAGVGPSYLDSLYQSNRKRFSTRFNFYDVVGVGMNFGERDANEIGLRLSHVSNAGIKHPNPGENFLQLRYARHF